MHSDPSRLRRKPNPPGEWGPGRETESQIARQIDREPDSQADRQTDRQTDRQMNIIYREFISLTA